MLCEEIDMIYLNRNNFEDEQLAGIKNFAAFIFNKNQLYDKSLLDFQPEKINPVLVFMRNKKEV